MNTKARPVYPVSGVPPVLPSGGGGISVFNSPEALELNRARLAHLESLGLPMDGRIVLDAGAGVGHLTGFFVERRCKVVAVDARPENILALRQRHPGVEAHVANVETDDLSHFGRFDIVFCYGLLYHLENPVAGLRNMASVCADLLLLETVVTDCEMPVMRLVDEPAETLNQAPAGLAARPSPAFVAMALTRAGFPFVYAPKEIPDHPDFRFKWTNDLEFSRSGHLLRCVFVASRREILNTSLLLLLAAPGQGPAGKFARRGEVAKAPARVWIDVGAHLGEKTFQQALDDPSLRVYAFEPNLAVAARRMGALPNYVVVPMAVAEHDGSADFYLNAYDSASSLLPFVPEGLAQWKGGEELKIEKKLTVPAIRLDTFLNSAGIETVEYLKIDAQGADFAVVRSAGERLKDIRAISLEVQITPVPLYAGGSEKMAVVRYLREAGFDLVSVEKQSHDQEENLTFVRRPAAWLNRILRLCRV